MFKAIYIFIILQTKLTKVLNPLQSQRTKIFNNKTIITVISMVLLIAGTIKNPFFIILPFGYLISISIAYKLGSMITDYAINAAFNWSIKWGLFIVFLYLSGFYLTNTFIFAMFMYILINITLNPTSFALKNRTNT